MLKLPYSEEYLRKELHIDQEIILNLDIDNYVEWLLNHKPTRDQKKRRVLELLENKDKTFANYRYAIYIVFIENSDPVSFDRWRKNQFENEKQFLENFYEGSPLSALMIKEKECARVIDTIKALHNDTMFEMINACYVDDYYGVACIAGFIDYLKSLDESKSQRKDVEKKVQNLPDKLKNKSWALTNVLLEWFKSGCQPIERNRISNMTLIGQVKKKVVENKFDELNGDYEPKEGSLNSAQSYYTAYQNLIEHFKQTQNKDALHLVEQKSLRVKNSYPNLNV